MEDGREAEILYCMAGAEKGYCLEIVMQVGARSTREAVLLPTGELAERFFALVILGGVTPLSLPAVYDDFLAEALSLLP